MMTFLQPVELDLEALALFPDDTWPLDELRLRLDLAAAQQQAAGEALAGEALQEMIEAKAEELLKYRAALRRADELEAERSGRANSWERVKLRDLFDAETIKPTVGHFIESDGSNGGGIFYRGKVNEIHGPSESGKTMVLLAVAAQEIKDGNNVVMIDMEDSGQGIVSRLVHVFGLTLDEIEERFWYFNPEAGFTDAQFDMIAAIPSPTFCIIDAVTEGMSTAGLDGRNENDVATWYNGFPKRLATLDIAVAVIDHTSNDRPDKAIGSQHKKSGISGVSYTAEPIREFVRGGKGHLRLAIAKDRPGGVREDALSRGEGKQYWRGDFRIDGSGDPAHPKVELWGIDPALLNPQPQGKSAERTVTMPPASLGPVLVALADDGEWMSTTGIGATTGISKDQARTYANRLVKCSPPLAVKKVTGTTVHYKATQDGLHSANAWVNQRREGGQRELE